MNAPVTHGGYTFYQSSYDIRSDRRLSFLSVSDDPGRPVVYFGYVGLCLGMVWVLSTRMRGQAATGDPA
jgi:cytochrome c biogenesis protein ResB